MHLTSDPRHTHRLSFTAIKVSARICRFQPCPLDDPEAARWRLNGKSVNAESPEQSVQVPHRLRIAVLLDHLNAFSGGYEAQLRDAIHAKCREAGHHLLLVYGGPVEAPQPLDAADNAIYELLRPDSVDGLIVVSSLLSTYCGPSGVARLVERFARATMCSVGIELPGVPSLVLDNRPGMEAVVEHLVRDHGRRKIAFLAGTPENPEARGSVRCLPGGARAPWDRLRSGLIARGHFRTNSAKVAMEEILARGAEFDAVVAANDEMATGAIDVLRKHGRRVPQDIPVTGFDDLLLARLGNPPLTTVAQPFDQVADWAVRAIEEQRGGSRGARAHAGRRAVRPPPIVRVRLRSVPTGSQALPLAQLHRPGYHGRSPRDPAAGAGGASGHGFSAAHRGGALLDGLRAEIGGRREAFHEAIVGLLDNAGTDNERQRMLHSAICYLRDELRALVELAGRTPPLRRAEPGRALQHHQPDAAPLAARRELPAPARCGRASIDRLRPGVAAGRAGQGSAQRRRAHRLSRVRAGREPGRCCAPRCAFGTASCWRARTSSTRPASLLPPGALRDETRESFLVLPLAFEDQLLGVIAFNYSDGINAYAAFRNEIAAALKSIRLREELVQTSLLHERSVQERLAATKRMEALSVLAGGVAHDLNNALGPLVALPGRHPQPARRDTRAGVRPRPARRRRGHQGRLAAGRADDQGPRSRSAVRGGWPRRTSTSTASSSRAGPTARFASSRRASRAINMIDGPQPDGRSSSGARSRSWRGRSTT